MENKLQKMFDYQSFAGNERIDRMMKEAEARYSREISDEDLGMVFAAGVPGVSLHTPGTAVVNQVNQPGDSIPD